MQRTSYMATWTLMEAGLKAVLNLTAKCQQGFWVDLCLLVVDALRGCGA